MVIAAATATAMQVRENLVGAMDCLLALSNGTGSGRLTLECGVRAEGRGETGAVGDICGGKAQK